MRVMVIGAGMIGAHSAVHLSRGGFTVTTVDIAPPTAYFSALGGNAGSLIRADVRDEGAIHAILSAGSYDAIIFAAGPTETQTEEGGSSALHFHASVPGETARIAAEHDIRCFILISSLAVYEGLKDLSAKEEAMVKPFSEYAKAKLTGERGALAYSERLFVQVLRPCGLYGMHQAGTGSSSAQLISTSLHSARENGFLNLNPDPNAADELLYVKDLSEAIWRCLVHVPSRTGSSVYNVGSGVKVSPVELAEAIKRVLPRTEVVFSSKGLGKSHFTPPLDVSAIQRELSFRPVFTLEQGLYDLLELNYAAHSE